MKLEDFLNQGWADHARDAAGVAARLPEGLKLIEREDQVPPFAHFATHVFGEHLGRWSDGLAFLETLRARSPAGPEAAVALARSAAVLRICGGEAAAADGLGRSDRIRISALAGAALAGQGESKRASGLLQAALQEAEAGLDKGDPANRALAVTGNNLACSLEEKRGRTAEETDLMLLSARTARKYWEIAGSWKEVLWAEYRLAMSQLQAGSAREALRHAQTCLKLADANGAAALERFFSFEALALAEKGNANQAGYANAAERARGFFGQLSEQDQGWCADTLKKLL